MAGSVKFLIESFTDVFCHPAFGDMDGKFTFEVKNTGFVPYTGVVVEIPSLKIKGLIVASGMRIPVGLLLPRTKRRVTITWGVKADAATLISVFDDTVAKRTATASGVFHFVPRFASSSPLVWHGEVPAIGWKKG